jgi:hypothetical protein
VFWDIYLYQDPPLWKANIDAVKYFNIDGGFELYEFGDLFEDEDEGWKEKIVYRSETRIVTCEFNENSGEWSKYAVVETTRTYGRY